MAENQDKARRARNGARLGGTHSRMEARKGNSRLDFDERSTVAWRSLEPFMPGYTGSPNEVADSQPRD